MVSRRESGWKRHTISPATPGLYCTSRPCTSSHCNGLVKVLLFQSQGEYYMRLLAMAMAICLLSLQVTKPRTLSVWDGSHKLDEDSLCKASLHRKISCICSYLRLEHQSTDLIV
jgi:hypothetical protein